MRVVVTGGAGFIGSHVVDALRDAGHEVIVVDQQPPRREDVTWAPVDVSDVAALTASFTDATVVFHLAAVADVNNAFADPVGTIDLNVTGTARVCDAARAAGVRRVVLASTVWVYGAAVDGTDAVDENTAFDLARPVHLYTSSKLAAELVVRSYQELYGLEFTVLRYGIPYGTRMRDSLVIPKFVQMALDGDPITLQGDGSQFRNYVYVEDLARAHVDALGPAAANEVFNLEGAEPVTIRALIDRIGVELGAPPMVTVVPARSGDYEGRPVSAAKAERLLGWKPEVPFAEGLRRYIRWHTTERPRRAQPDAAAPVMEPIATDPAPLVAAGLLALPFAAALNGSGFGIVAGLVSALAAVVGFAFTVRRRLPGFLSAAFALLGVWLQSQTTALVPLALVGALVGAAAGGLGMTVVGSVRDRLRQVAVVVFAGATLLAAGLLWPSTLFWIAALEVIAAVTAKTRGWRLTQVRVVPATAMFVTLAFVTVCSVGATSANAAWFGPVVTHGSRTSPAVAITFHGKADSSTLDALGDELSSAGDQATFFVPARALPATRPAVERLLNNGNLLADYQSSPHGVTAFTVGSGPVAADRSSFNTELQLCPRFVRPPNGIHTPLMALAAHDHGMRLVTWEQLVSDADDSSPHALGERVATRARPGSIIAFDLRQTKTEAGRRQLLQIVPAVLARLHQRGLQPVRIDQLLHRTPYDTVC